MPFDRRVWQEATTLKKAGYEVSIICPTGFNAAEKSLFLDGINIYRHDLPFEAAGWAAYFIEYPVALFHQLRLAWRIRRKHGFDVIHACNPPDLIFLVGIFFKLFFGTRFLFDHHDLGPELYEAKFGRRGLFYWGLRICEWLTFRIADVAIATNESYRKIAIERGGKLAQRVFVVRSGPNLSRLRVVPPNPSHRNGRTYLVGYVGVMGKQEGIDLLLESVRYLVFERNRIDIQFAVVGGGPELSAMQALSQQLQIDDYIYFTGRVTDDEFLSVLNTADVCVNPDRVNDMNDKSTMNKIMEYMALGKPIVQFEMTEGRVSAQNASLYAKPNDPTDFAEKILLLLGEPETRARMGELGRQRVIETLSWEHEVPALLRAYGAIFEAQPSRSLAANPVMLPPTET